MSVTPAIFRTAFCWIVALAVFVPPALVTAQEESDVAKPPAAEQAPAEDTPAEETPAEPETAEQPEPQPESQPQPTLPQEIVLRDYLLLPRVGKYGRAIVARDPIDAALASGSWKPPSEGDKVTAADGKVVRWKKAMTKPDGAVVRPDPGGYAFATIDSPAERVVLLEATRHASVCVNGQWLTGDPYGYGWVRLPVQLKQGPNELLFHVAGSGFKAKLVELDAPAGFIVENATLPDAIEGESGELWGAVPIINMTAEPLRGARMLMSLDGGELVVATLPVLPALSVYKLPFEFELPATSENKTHAMRLTLQVMRDGKRTKAAACLLSIKRVGKHERQTRTYLSRIDHSVQPYSVVPAVPPSPEDHPPGVILALHDKGVGHARHAGNYVAKNWAHVVAPQCRGGYDFDWEDWGATAAMEALADAQARFPHDPSRTYVTGHSMGAHGALRLGVTRPDQFAAIAPSAGWVSLWTYGGGMPAFDQPTPLEQMLLRAAAPSDTAKLIGNLAPLGVYLLHGEKDSNVRVTQSRFMRRRLGEFHQDFAYYERRGAGNWWGKDCCDWAPMMEFLRNRTTRPLANVRRVDFTTPSLALSAGSHWVRIEAQDEQAKLSNVAIQLTKSASSSLFRGTTQNVKRLSLDASFLPADKPVRIQLDGARFVSAKAGDARIWLARDSHGQWAAIARPPGGKHPARNGGFKSVFDHNAILVYSTGGTPEENAWSQAKARYDAQTFWYRGAGSLDVVADADFDAARQSDRNVVLYGNADTNKAWPVLLSLSPIQVRGGRVNVSRQGTVRPESGDGLAVLFVRPRPGSSTATVAVVGGAGLSGMRLTDRIRYFLSGVHLPDLTILGPAAPVEGEAGIRAVGYFGHDWRVETGDIEWRDMAI